MSKLARLGCALALALSLPVLAAPTLAYRVVRVEPHDSSRFTQGFTIAGGRVIESAGGYGRSLLSVAPLGRRNEERVHRFPSTIFAEGVTALPHGVLQLSWRAGVAMLFDFDLQLLDRFAYDGEGWGITFDGERLLMSDGSSRLQVRSATTFRRLSTIEVKDQGQSVPHLNELEYARGYVLANVWHSDRVAVIDPGSGAVRAWLNLSRLRQGFRKPSHWNPREHVLNGIAYDATTGQYWFTGKCWPVVFVIEIEDIAEPGA